MARKIAGAPDYDSPEFWDVRFATGKDVGEWLNSGEILLDLVLSDLKCRSGLGERSPRVLHLGPGVSQLGMKLRDAYVEQHWTGNSIVVSVLCTSNSGLATNCPRMWISLPRPFGSAKRSKTERTQNRQCTGTVLISSRGIMLRNYLTLHPLT